MQLILLVFISGSLDIFGKENSTHRIQGMAVYIQFYRAHRNMFDIQF